MTWAEVAQPISCNFCAQEFGDLQSYYAHARLTPLPVPAPTTRTKQRTRKQLRCNATRTKQDGGSTGSTVQRRRWRSNRVMFKTILKTHQTMVRDTMLVKTLSPEAENMQTYGERALQERRWHTQGPPFVWAYLGLIKVSSGKKQ